MTKRIRMSEAVPQAKCAKSWVNHAWIAGFVAVNGHRAKMIGKLIRINDSIGELALLFQPEGALFGKYRLGEPTPRQREMSHIISGLLLNKNGTPTMLRNVLAVALIAAAISAGLNQPARAQQAGGIVIDLPEVRNYVSLGAGVIPDYKGSDDYTVGVAPAGLMKFGKSDRYARLLVTELSVNVLDSRNWSLGPVLNYRFARDDVDDSAVKLMRDIDGTFEAGLFAG